MKKTATNQQAFIVLEGPMDDRSIDGSIGSVQVSDEDLELFLKEIKEAKKELSILCCGAVGSGKSTLLNGLMGDGKWSEEFPVEFPVQTSLCRGTSKVDMKIFVRKGIKVTVWDTPGLEGGDNDEEYLQEIKEKCAKFDLFLYCTDINEKRATDLFDKKSSLVKLTQLFSAKKLWKNAIVILTQANGVVADLQEQKREDASIDVDAKFISRVSMWQHEIHESLKKLGYNKAHKVPVMPAGTAVLRDLPGYPYWLSKIFEKVIDRMKREARLAYLEQQNDRVQDEGNATTTPNLDQGIEQQQFVVKTKYKIIALAASLGVGAGGAIAGAATGATIGALVIGIPSFGAFAISGLVVGGVLGAGVGFGCSVATAIAFKYFKKKRDRKKNIVRHPEL